ALIRRLSRYSVAIRCRPSQEPSTISPLWEMTRTTKINTRLDQRFSEKDQVFGRYSYFHDVDQPVPFLPDGSGNLTTGVIGLTDTLGQQVVGNYLHTFTARMLNDLRVGYT